MRKLYDQKLPYTTLDIEVVEVVTQRGYAISFPILDPFKPIFW